MGEAALRALFDTAQSSNPGKTKLAEGLRAWVKFGNTVTGQGKHRVVESTEPLLYNRKFAERILDRRDAFKKFQVLLHHGETTKSGPRCWSSLNSGIQLV
jgi:hypothetical protein